MVWQTIPAISWSTINNVTPLCSNVWRVLSKVRNVVFKIQEPPPPLPKFTTHSLYPLVKGVSLVACPPTRLCLSVCRLSVVSKV